MEIRLWDKKGRLHTAHGPFSLVFSLAKVSLGCHGSHGVRLAATCSRELFHVDSSLTSLRLHFFDACRQKNEGQPQVLHPACVPDCAEPWKDMACVVPHGCALFMPFVRARASSRLCDCDCARSHCFWGLVGGLHVHALRFGVRVPRWGCAALVASVRVCAFIQKVGAVCLRVGRIANFDFLDFRAPGPSPP